MKKPVEPGIGIYSKNAPYIRGREVRKRSVGPFYKRISGGPSLRKEGQKGIKECFRLLVNFWSYFLVLEKFCRPRNRNLREKCSIYPGSRGPETPRRGSQEHFSIEYGEHFGQILDLFVKCWLIFWMSNSPEHVKCNITPPPGRFQTSRPRIYGAFFA